VTFHVGQWRPEEPTDTVTCMIRPRSQIVFPGGIYHLGTRGVRRVPIAHDDGDRTWFVGELAKVVEKFNWDCLGYCVMTNHYHLIVRTPDANLSDGMQKLNFRYSYRFNRRHGFVGHLFEDRFWAEVIEDDAQLVATVQYVDLNPVRAGICSAPEQWRWSSCAAMLGLAPAPAFLAVNDLLSLLGGDAETARVAYALRLRDAVQNGHAVLPGKTTRLDQPNPYVPAKRVASRRTSSAAGRPTTLR
jgi:REP-associated tyrosine transposase